MRTLRSDDYSRVADHPEGSQTKAIQARFSGPTAKRVYNRPVMRSRLTSRRLLVAAVMPIDLLELPRVSAPSETRDLEKSGVKTSFEVASIKPNPIRNPYAVEMFGGDIAHEMLRAATPESLITFAYSIEGFQLSVERISSSPI